MTKHEANKHIIEKFMGQCYHVRHDGSRLCSKCGKTWVGVSIPNYCEDANQSVLIWNHLPPGYRIEGDHLGLFWEVYDVKTCVARGEDFRIVTCKAALHSLGITEEIVLH